MKRFSYQAKDIRTKKIVKGTVQADNEKAAGRILVDQGYVPQKIKDADKQSFIQKFLNRVTTKDRVTFTRQFATLIGAGLPLSASLRTVAEQTENKSMKLIVEEVLASVEGGKTLAESLARYPEVFNHLYISLVEAGETGGTLDESLRRLADQQEKDASMISKIRGAMVYPAIIFVVIIAVLAFMMILVVPQVDSLYSDMGEELPGLTKFLVAMSGFFAQFWWIILIMVGVLVWVFVQFRRTEIGIRWFATAKLNMPLFKGMFQRLYMSRFTRTMQMLLAAGVSMLDAMTIAADATANVVVQKQIMEAAEQVKGGKPLSESLEGRKYILDLVPQMASIGEQSGKIDEMLGRAAKVFTDELDEQIANISTMIEPVLMVIMAALIGIVIGGTLLPIYSLVSKI
jgi:type IV pilus assembly protein PilC